MIWENHVSGNSQCKRMGLECLTKRGPVWPEHSDSGGGWLLRLYGASEAMAESEFDSRNSGKP